MTKNSQSGKKGFFLGSAANQMLKGALPGTEGVGSRPSRFQVQTQEGLSESEAQTESETPQPETRPATEKLITSPSRRPKTARTKRRSHGGETFRAGSEKPSETESNSAMAKPDLVKTRQEPAETKPLAKFDLADPRRELLVVELGIMIVLLLLMFGAQYLYPSREGLKPNQQPSQTRQEQVEQGSSRAPVCKGEENSGDFLVSARRPKFQEFSIQDCKSRVVEIPAGSCAHVEAPGWLEYTFLTSDGKAPPLEVAENEKVNGDRPTQAPSSRFRLRGAPGIARVWLYPCPKK